jgi:hypothetical protein
MDANILAVLNSIDSELNCISIILFVILLVVSLREFGGNKK